MLRSLIQRLRLLLRSELDLQTARLIPELSLRISSDISEKINAAAKTESRFSELGWKTRVKDGKTYVSGLDFTFDNVAHAHLLSDLEFMAILVRDLNAKLTHLPDGRVEVQIGQVRVVPETARECSDLVEIFRDEIYGVVSAQPMFVWDVGASNGSASLYFAGELGWDVAAFELFPETGNAALDNIARSGMAQKIHVTVAGVGGTDETRKLAYDSKPRGGNGLYGNDTAPADDSKKLVEVQVRDASAVLTTVLERAGDRPVLAKFDCQGAEHEIVSRLEATDQLRSIAAIIMELHVFPDLEPSRVISSLTKAGFLVKHFHHASGHPNLVYATRLGP